MKYTKEVWLIPTSNRLCVDFVSSNSWSCSVPIAATKFPPRHQPAMSLLCFIFEGSNLVVLSTSPHCLGYVGISPYRHGSKESLSKRKMANLGNFARQVLKLFD
ncbi:hypothetical protein F2Q70_00042409 [Brassica cretica]|uniref:Uncharacterized protein n=1 Tax=Brassica cretica TaxID=69181 RepID=A0A8S9KM07_BRACR|nr:hypothetical protein F2Q70_00042409 [Brassica cretica]KAF3515951.1 hypothetical protein DY000_02058691 [Brassica cretica]